MKYTQDSITKLEPNEIFVFGSNSKGIHGKGAALIARQKFGAIYGQASGLQGQSYAIITKKDWRVAKSSSLQEIGNEIYKMITFARLHQELTFYVVKLGCSLAGYSESEIKSLFYRIENEFGGIPSNVILPKVLEVRST